MHEHTAHTRAERSCDTGAVAHNIRDTADFPDGYADLIADRLGRIPDLRTGNARDVGR